MYFLNDTRPIHDNVWAKSPSLKQVPIIYGNLPPPRSRPSFAAIFIDSYTTIVMFARWMCMTRQQASKNRRCLALPFWFSFSDERHSLPTVCRIVYQYQCWRCKSMTKRLFAYCDIKINVFQTRYYSICSVISILKRIFWMTPCIPFHYD